MIQYFIYYNFSVFCIILSRETKNIFKKSTPLIMASSETKKLIGTIWLSHLEVNGNQIWLKGVHQVVTLSTLNIYT